MLVHVGCCKQVRGLSSAKCSSVKNSRKITSSVYPRKNKELFNFSLFNIDASDKSKIYFKCPNPTLRRESQNSKSLCEPIPELDISFIQSRSKSSNNFIPNEDTNITRLDNGLIVASQDLYSPMSAVGIYIKAGTRYENDDTLGMSMLLESLSFKDTQTKTADQVVGKLESLGAQVLTSNSQDLLIYSAEVLRDNLDPVLEIMADTLKNSVFVQETVDAQIEKLKKQLIENKKKPQIRVIELLHQVAYRGDPLGQELIVSPEKFNKFKAEDLYHYVRNNFTGHRIALTGVNVEHNEFTTMVKKYFGSIPKHPEPNSGVSVAPVGEKNQVPPVYLGGMVYYPTEEDIEKSIVTVAFKCGGLNDLDFHVAYCLKSLMGGGSSFSAGGPGKGIYTRLYEGVLNQFGWVDNCESFIFSYNDTGLFGITGECCVKNTSNMLDVICEQFYKVSKGISEEELTRAKNQFKSSIMYNLETRSVIYDDIGRHIMAFGKRILPSELEQMIDEITVDKILGFVKKIISTPPTVVVYSTEQHLNQLVDYEVICQYFKNIA